MDPASMHICQSAGELEVLMLLQRANLTQYFQAFVDHGGDDVQQLLELLHEPQEFAQLLKLVGMDKKPLHVHRFRKALQKLPTAHTPPNQTPTDDPGSRLPVEKPPLNCATASCTSDWPAIPPLPQLSVNTLYPNSQKPTSESSSKGVLWQLLPMLSPSQGIQTSALAQMLASSLVHPSSATGFPVHRQQSSQTVSQSVNQSPLPLVISSLAPLTIPVTTVASSSPLFTAHKPRLAPDRESLSRHSQDESLSVSSLTDTPTMITDESGDSVVLLKAEDGQSAVTTSAESVDGSTARTCVENNNDNPESVLSIRPSANLMNTDILKLVTAVNAILPHLPSFPLRQLNSRSSVEKELKELFALPPEDPVRVEGLRRHSAIFGRFDAPKRMSRPLRHFEMCINEITSRLVKSIPELVAQREHLFHIARQIVSITNYGLTFSETGQVLWHMLDPDLICKSTDDDESLSTETTDGENDGGEKTGEEASIYLKKLNCLKIEMQELVNTEEELRSQLRKTRRDLSSPGQSQLKRQLEKLVVKLHSRVAVLAKYVVLYNSGKTVISQGGGVARPTESHHWGVQRVIGSSKP
ncbi:unnamed protein product [Calicophoron daubneyi]|uniref:Uncharacterized protein n=1 Tax=Calicophoron daubneyi TaxID=300641 RepID=A0AAV2T6Q6_CALDB